MMAAQSAMTPTENNPNVVGFDFESTQAKAAKAAYPLTVPVYAALNPLQSDAASRKAFANMIKYAVTSGQTPGTELGELPPGYAPLSDELVDLAKSAANSILNGVSPIDTEPTFVPEPIFPDVDGGGLSPDGGLPNGEKSITPGIPQIAITANAVQFAGACTICALIISPLFILSKRRR
jgi:hypothetical protein